MASIAGPYPITEPMSILISPSDNTGWGIGTSLLRATGLRFTKDEPVRVRAYYRAQWGQRNGRKSKAALRKDYKRYKIIHLQRQKARKRRRYPLAAARRHAAAREARRLELVAQRRAEIAARRAMRRAQAAATQAVVDGAAAAAATAQPSRKRKRKRRSA